MHWSEMKLAVHRAAERELELDIGDKPINDPQIMGSPYDVHVEGKYLGWTSKERCDELRKIYAATPSRLQTPGRPARETNLDGVVSEIGIVTKKCREVEADMTIAVTPIQAGDAASRGVQEIRQRLEVLHEKVLLMQERQTR